MDSNSTRTIDWLAIRAAYESSDVPLRLIAELHGVSKSLIRHRRVKEAWPKRSESGRIVRRPGAVTTDQVDWPAVRHDYETGEHSLAEVTRLHGCSLSRLQQQKDLEHWQARRPSYPRAYSAGGKVSAPQRFKAGLAQKLATLAARLDLAEKIDLSEPLKGLNTLADAYEKLLEVREKSGDDSDRLHINDGTRDALAERLEALARSWERRRDSAGTGSKAAGAD